MKVFCLGRQHQTAVEQLIKTSVERGKENRVLPQGSGSTTAKWLTEWDWEKKKILGPSVTPYSLLSNKVLVSNDPFPLKHGFSSWPTHFGLDCVTCLDK